MIDFFTELVVYMINLIAARGDTYVINFFPDGGCI